MPLRSLIAPGVGHAWRCACSGVASVMGQWVWQNTPGFSRAGQQLEGMTSMFRTAAAVLTVLVAAATAGGANAAAASGAPAHASRHGAERLVFVGTSTKPGLFSVIATGLFTDGGTINIFSPEPDLRLGSGTFKFHDKDGPGKSELNRATCLRTITGRGTYRLSHGTGKYAGFTGSGRFTTIGRAVYPRKANGTCASSHPLAFQGITTLTGTVTKS